MTPLDDRDLILFVEERESVAHVVDNEAEDTQTLRYSELIAVCGFVWCARCFTLQQDGVIGLKHDEL